MLDALLAASDRAEAPPWRAIVEGRDQLGGDSFIMVGVEGAYGTDIYVTRDRTPAASAAQKTVPVRSVRRRKPIDQPPSDWMRISMRRLAAAIGSAGTFRRRSAKPVTWLTRFSSRPPRTSM